VTSAGCDTGGIRPASLKGKQKGCVQKEEGGKGKVTD